MNKTNKSIYINFNAYVKKCLLGTKLNFVNTKSFESELEFSDSNITNHFSETFEAKLIDGIDFAFHQNAIDNISHETLLDYYVYGFTDEEIGFKHGISKQAVHKRRKKAIVQYTRYINGTS